MMKNLGNNIVSFNLNTTFIGNSRETKEYAIGKYLEATGFQVIDSSKSMIVAKIPDNWTMKFAYGDDNNLVGICDGNDNMRIESYIPETNNKTKLTYTSFKCRYEVYVVNMAKSSNRTTYMVDNARGKRKVFSVLPYFDPKQIKLAKKVMLKRFPEMDNPLAYWK